MKAGLTTTRTPWPFSFSCNIIFLSCLLFLFFFCKTKVVHFFYKNVIDVFFGKRQVEWRRKSKGHHPMWPNLSRGSPVEDLLLSFPDKHSMKKQMSPHTHTWETIFTSFFCFFKIPLPQTHLKPPHSSPPQPKLFKPLLSHPLQPFTHCFHSDLASSSKQHIVIIRQ